MGLSIILKLLLEHLPILVIEKGLLGDWWRTLQDAWSHAEIIRARYLRRSYVAGHSQIITTLMLQPTSILWVHIWRIQIGKSKMLEVIDETGV